MAWRLQAQALGGLSERAQRRAGELAEEASLRLRAPRPFEVEVLARGFGYRGQVYGR
jgi:hypothetical protein